jgi:hypothetical protein
MPALFDMQQFARDLETLFYNASQSGDSSRKINYKTFV